MFLQGLWCVITPDTSLYLFKEIGEFTGIGELPGTNSWTRVWGIAISALGIFYVVNSYSDRFINSTIIGRYWLVALVAYLILFEGCEPTLSMLAIFDASMATITLILSIRKNHEKYSTEVNV